MGTVDKEVVIPSEDENWQERIIGKPIIFLIIPVSLPLLVIGNWIWKKCIRNCR